MGRGQPKSSILHDCSGIVWIPSRRMESLLMPTRNAADVS